VQKYSDSVLGNLRGQVSQSPNWFPACLCPPLPTLIFKNPLYKPAPLYSESFQFPITFSQRVSSPSTPSRSLVSGESLPLYSRLGVTTPLLLDSVVPSCFYIEFSLFVQVAEPCHIMLSTAPFLPLSIRRLVKGNYHFWFWLRTKRHLSGSRVTHTLWAPPIHLSNLGPTVRHCVICNLL